MCAGSSITCNRENSVEAAISVRQMQPVTHLNLMSLAPGKVHQGATNVAAQLEHFPVDVKILAIATACQGCETTLVSSVFFTIYIYIFIFKIQFKCWTMDAHRYQRQCSQVPCPAGTVGPSARLCNGCHWNMEQSCHRRCGRGLSRADWQPLLSYLSLMQGPYRAAPARKHSVPRWRSNLMFAPFHYEKRSNDDPLMGGSQGCFFANWIQQEALNSRQIQLSRPPEKRHQGRADAAHKNK